MAIGSKDWESQYGKSQFEGLHYKSVTIKVGLSPSKKFGIIYLIESPLKEIKNAFYFILTALFVLKIFKFLSRLLGHVEKTASLER